MKKCWWIAVAVLALSLGTRHSLLAQAPAGATAICKDGTYTYSASHRGACSRHHGVKQWLAPTSPKADSQPVSPKGKGQPDQPGVKVWVNTPTMVYHCPGDRWYGATKKGAYMTEAAAKAAGARPAYGRACS